MPKRINRDQKCNVKKKKKEKLIASEENSCAI